MCERRDVENLLHKVKHDINTLKSRSKWTKFQFKKLQLIRLKLERTLRDYDDEKHKRKYLLDKIVSRNSLVNRCVDGYSPK